MSEGVFASSPVLFRQIRLAAFLMALLPMAACSVSEPTAQMREEIPTPYVGDTPMRDGRIEASFLPESGAAFQYNPPTVVGDFLYIGTSSKLEPDGRDAAYLAGLPDNFIYKMDLNLVPVWTYPLGKTMVDGGVTLDSRGNLYFVTIDFAPLGAVPDPKKGGGKGYRTDLNLVSLDGEGGFRWRQPISQPGESWIHGMVNCAIGSDDTIYVGGRKLFAFRPDGYQAWEYPSADPIIAGLRSAPIIDSEGNVYFVSPEPTEGGWETDRIYVYKFSPGAGGIPVWSTLLDNQVLDPEGGSGGGGAPERWILSSPAFSGGEASLYAVVGNTINRVDTGTGALLWTMKPAGATGSFKASPAVDAEDNLYLGTKSNKESIFYAIKADGSGLLWTIPIQADMYPSPLLGDDGKVYFGSETSPSGRFHAADRLTGALAWNIEKEVVDLSFGSPLLYKGFIYIGVFQRQPSSDTLFKIRADAQGYLQGAAWPRFHGGNANDGRSRKP